MLKLAENQYAYKHTTQAGGPKKFSDTSHIHLPLEDPTAPGVQHGNQTQHDIFIYVFNQEVECFWLTVCLCQFSCYEKSQIVTTLSFCNDLTLYVFCTKMHVNHVTITGRHP